MYCRRCGAFVSEGNRFCTNCGIPLQELPPAPPTPVRYEPEPGYVPPRYRPPVEPVSKPARDYGHNEFLFAAPDLNEPMGTPKPVAEPVEIPPLDPVYEQPVVAPAPEPVVEQLVVAPALEPVYEQPVVAPAPEPVYEQPVVAPAPEPVFEQPVVAPAPQPVYEQPVVAPAPEPVYEQPVVVPAPEPVFEQPVVAPVPEPVFEQPVVVPAPQPVFEQPVVVPAPEPVFEQPAVVPTPLPVYEQPAVAPVTNEYSYEVPVYNAPPADNPDIIHRPVNKTSVGNKIISIIICLFMFVSVIGAVTSLTTKSLISDDYAKHIADNIDYKEISEIEDKEYTKEDFKDIFSIADIKQDDVKTVKTIASLPVLIICLGLFVVMAFLMFLVKKFKISAMLWCGVSLFAAGLVYTLYGVLAPLLMEKGIEKVLFEDFAQGKIMFNGLIIMGTAILIIAVYIVLNVIKNKKVAK